MELKALELNDLPKVIKQYFHQELEAKFLWAMFLWFYICFAPCSKSWV